MNRFKFLAKKQQLDYDFVWVDYTIGFNTKSCILLKFSTADDVLSTRGLPNIYIFEGTFIEFREMVLNNPELCWYSNLMKPLIRVMQFYSQGWRNWQIRGDYGYFRRSRRRIKKEQKLRIYYEIIV